MTTKQSFLETDEAATNPWRISSGDALHRSYGQATTRAADSGRMDPAETMEWLGIIRTEYERQWDSLSRQFGKLTAENRRRIQDEYDGKLTALAMALDAIRGLP